MQVQTLVLVCVQVFGQVLPNLFQTIILLVGATTYTLNHHLLVHTSHAHISLHMYTRLTYTHAHTRLQV